MFMSDEYLLPDYSADRWETNDPFGIDKGDEKEEL